MIYTPETRNAPAPVYCYSKGCQNPVAYPCKARDCINWLCEACYRRGLGYCRDHHEWQREANRLARK